MTEYAEKVLQIRQRFLASLGERLAGIEAAISKVEDGTPGAEDDLHLVLHDLTGNAAMLGLDEITVEARRGLDVLESGRLDATSDAALALSEIRASVIRLHDLQKEHGQSE